MSHLTLEQQATNFETFRHIEKVRDKLGDMVVRILERAALHDQSKLESPEVEYFAEFTAYIERSRPGLTSQIRNGEAMHRWDVKNRISFHEPAQDDVLLEMEEACPGVSEQLRDGHNRSALVAARLFPGNLWGGWGRQLRFPMR